jgi:uncharacterized protein
MENNTMMQQIAHELKLGMNQVKQTVALLDEGNTVPFIARYRKEMTGELDENDIRSIEERLNYLRQLGERKADVIRNIEEQGKLTDELRQAIEKAVKLQEVEDLYRPYKQKRKTRASVAKERGLEPLAEFLASQPSVGDPLVEAAKYVDTEKEVPTAEDAIQGAMDILAEQISDDAAIRQWVRKATKEQGVIVTEVKDSNQESVYEMYYDYREPVGKLPPHRTLAINRGEKEDVLRVKVEAPAERIVEYIQKQWIKGESVTRSYLVAMIEDSYKRLVAPSIERDIRGELTEVAEEHAIHIFAENLRNLLLQAPVRGKVVLGIDPAYRTGCKLAVVDDTGKLLDVAVTYPTPPANKVAEAERIIAGLVDKHRVDIMTIGNGTASRETEQFVAQLIPKLSRPVVYIIVSEAGASVYSASKLAGEEFPKLDVAERSAVSIARRLQDPLAELVKIDPKAIGVGQYQHDVAPKKLEESLKVVVESAVNHVGVDVNTASPSLLSYVSGVSSTIAKNIVKYREENGRFTHRTQLQSVPRLGAKTFEQCVGFMRISEGANALDQTPIHPESYDVVGKLLGRLDLQLNKIGSPEFKEKLTEIAPEKVASELGVGVPTLRDIVGNLIRPGRDPREEVPPPIFRTDVLQLEDLKAGMELKGTVRNVVDFGAFVDIGVKNDGLVHISRLSQKFVKHPLDVVAVGDVVTVWVLDIDLKKGRVSLTMLPQ